MMNKWLAGASLLALGLVSVGAKADPLTISTATTAPVRTGAASGGTPGDITITTAGGITLSAPGTAVTIDSNNSATNQGAINSTGNDNTVGIQAINGVAGNISNAGTITVSESYTRTDSNNDGVLDGPYAQGSNRFGIQTLGTSAGAISNTGTITVQGKNSAGVALGGTLSGGLTTSGTISVAGDNSYGVTTKAVTGDVALGGTITSYGTGNSAALIGGDVGGTVTVNGSLFTSGYSSPTLPATTTSLTADNLKQSGPALWIQGNVAKGVQLLSSVTTTTTNSDGTTTTTTSPAANLITYGSAPGLLIGSAANAITLGSLASDSGGFGLSLGGAITGNGVYAGLNGTAVQLGGLGQSVAILNGIRVGGQVAGISNGGSATGMLIGSGVSTPTLVVSGRISGTTAGTLTGTPVATGLSIASGASLPSIINSGVISGGAVTGASAIGIYDGSGTLSSITNNGTIQATGGTTNVAIDLSKSNNASIVQASASSSVVPAMSGDIRFGSGTNTLTVNAGSVVGNVAFNGSSAAMTLANATTYSGNVDFGGHAAALSIGGTSSFSGGLLNGGNAAVIVNGGTLAPALGTTNSIGSLSMTGGTLKVAIDGTTGTASLLNVAGDASFTGGTKLAVQLSGLSKLAGNYTVLQAGSLTGANTLLVTGITVPYLFDSAFTISSANTALQVSISRKNASQLGLNAVQTTVYDAAFAAAGADSAMANNLLAITNNQAAAATFQQMLPVFETGAFDTVSLATRATNRILAENEMPALTNGHIGAWIQLVGWSDKKGVGDTQPYKTYGSGFSVGFEHDLGGVGRIGITGLYGWGVNNDTADAAGANSTDKRVGLYWRGTWGGFHAYATGSYGWVTFKNDRVFNGTSGTGTFSRQAAGDWGGNVTTGSAGVSYQIGGKRFYLRPAASIDYVKLKEDAYSETGGGTGFDLNVNSRTSSETGVNGALTVGYYLNAPTGEDHNYLRFEIEGGARSLIDSKMGALTASFAGGNPFTLSPEARSSGWTGTGRLVGGSRFFSLVAELGAEKQQDHVAGTARVGLQIKL